MVRTRFAPSPTGFLHIGGVRTALFNWLFARHHGGRFVLRIDDTDQKRNVEEALQPILDGLRWLGIDWDEGGDRGGEYGPYHQSQRLGRYQEAVRLLLDKGLAYWDYALPEELADERDAARAQGGQYLYSRCWAAQSPEDRRRFEGEGRVGVVRLKMPRAGRCEFSDLVRGEMSVIWTQEMDHVIQRADGTCLYHLANVVDDHDMAISHVIRAEEHLSNTPRQIFIAQGLGYEPPTYAHLPYVAEPGSKSKLSKRKLAKYLKNPDFAEMNSHGARIAAVIGLEANAESFNPVIVDFYEKVGYLPEAVVNYLLLLGWALDDKTEFLSREEMITLFSLERVNRAPASFAPAKLLAFQEHYMHALPAPQKVSVVRPFVIRAGWAEDWPAEHLDTYLEAIVSAAGDRLKVAGDILDYADFFVDAVEYEEKAFRKRLRKPAGVAERLARLREKLVSADNFAAAALEEQLRVFVESEGIKIGEIIHALRVALTGKAVGFGLFETMEILGKERTLARLDRARDHLAAS